MTARLAVALLLTLQAPAVAQPAPDALTARVLAELDEFTSWLDRHDVQGYIGEVGWPDNRRGDAERWNALAEMWFDEADEAGLWVSYWATGEWWADDYILAAYEDRDGTGGVESAGTQAPVLEAHLGNGRGIVDAGGEFGYAPTNQPTSPFSNENPGRYDQAYHYDTSATFEYIASRGIGEVKIPFRWERLQPRLGKALDGDELTRLRGAVDRAGAAGLEVIIDMHNFGAYYVERGGTGRRCSIGQRRCTVKDFADAWRRIARAFRETGQVTGYTLMTEPVDMKKVGKRSGGDMWRRASQAAVSAIRKAGEKGAVLFVSGYQWSGAADWNRYNPAPWIRDPANLIRYEAHHYWDQDHSGTYRGSYAEEVAAS